MVRLVHVDGESDEVGATVVAERLSVLDCVLDVATGSVAHSMRTRWFM